MWESFGRNLDFLRMFTSPLRIVYARRSRRSIRAELAKNAPADEENASGNVEMFTENYERLLRRVGSGRFRIVKNIRKIRKLIRNSYETGFERKQSFLQEPKNLNLIRRF
ncbi:hypothetical protein Zmor_016931 [Zophobas morio]|uniref:Uncharacterized protein n=1 Tax=Zophobas morio TaxID=2755281 RepID=A0AA38I852_9CUCU|nr:hypothetical protein Zmor_016931 [Zophobas morio]